ncbi:ABC transporter ATP-binding protein [Acuticoccus sp. M5D2P5]|uniref:ABC transporter ATP-binding protein n=1 Tax=Acuticoccus kalidii TaxID=2910977 RepID=UPI001F43D5D0|nr:ABC transporter ATP-binding protein [Acuticoccus kalidii]MCF3932638.1 ABC transporter ATP-binding protein [Acuticoccus kalidii]
MAELVVNGLTRSFGDVRAVDGIDFTVADGEFLTLLGPSGCGKSTTLAAVAGLDKPDGGRITLGSDVFFDAADGTFVPSERREIGLVFQSYALWPHLTVRQNLEFPLKLRNIKRKDRAQRIEEALGLVEMTAYADRYPHALSGGQQQRVALARTLVYRPGLLLLDEPLSNLDAKLRERARTWLRHLQSHVRVTTVYVTHDQAEALALSDRIAVMNGGKIAQLADPHTIYDRPADAFIADFIGSSNFLCGTVTEADHGTVKVDLDGAAALIAPSARPLTAGTRVRVSVRPEQIEIVEPGTAGPNVFPVTIEERTFLGAYNTLEVKAGENAFRVECRRVPDTDMIHVHIPETAGIVFPETASR